MLNYKIEKKRKNNGLKSKGNKYILKEKKKRRSKDPRNKKEFNTIFCCNFICGLLIYLIAVSLFVRVSSLTSLTLFW